MASDTRGTVPETVAPEATPPEGLYGSHGSHEVVIVGTAHVSDKSVQEVRAAIDAMRPDIVAVELCPARYRSMTGQDEPDEIKISELLSGGKLYFFMIQWLLAYVQKKIGSDMGVKPGADMLAAVEEAKKAGIRVALVDRDVGITIQRFWSAMSFFEKTKLLFSLVPAAFGWGDKDLDIDNITQDDIVTQMIEEFRKLSPAAASALVDERDAYIARNLHSLSKEGRVLAVVGAGHKRGIERYLARPESIPDIKELSERPKKRVSVSTVFSILVMLFIFGIFGLMLISGISLQDFLLAFGIWFLATGSLSGVGVVLARGHPLSALTAFLIAWMTTLNPLVAAGWFAGMVEAWKRKPTVNDLRVLAQANSFDEMMENRFFKVIWVAALANLGAMAGTFVGLYLIVQRLGLVDPSDLLGNALANLTSTL